MLSVSEVAIACAQLEPSSASRSLTADSKLVDDELEEQPEVE